MSQISQELNDEAKKHFLPVAKQLADEGVDLNRIVEVFGKHKRTRRQDLMKHTTNASGFANIIEDMKSGNKTNATESAFYNLLKKHGIPFEFQVKIGRYRVDYLIAESLIFEGDGPHHDMQVEYDAKRDRYLESLGYTVMRMKWDLVSMMKDRVIEEIQRFVAEQG